MSEPLSSSIGDVRNFFNQEDKPEETNVVEKPEVEEVEEVENEEVADKGKQTKETPDEDEIELSEEDEEPEEKLEEIKVEGPPRKKEVLKAYPDIFKKFPWFEQMMFRDKQYSELFGTFDEAKEAIETAGYFKELESDLMNGNTEVLLNTIKQADPKAFKKITDNYLDTLVRVDREAYLSVAEDFGRMIIKQMVETARQDKNQELYDHAIALNEHLFGEKTPRQPRERKEPEKKDSELENERKSFNQERLEHAQVQLSTKIENVLKTTIEGYIDPKGEMSPYTKKNAIKDVMSRLNSELRGDPTFVKAMDRMWKVAFSSKFDQESMSKIRSTYLGNSKQRLGTIIRDVRNEVLKEVRTAPRKKEEIDEDKPFKSKGTVNAGRPHQSSGKKNEMLPGESVRDFFHRD